VRAKYGFALTAWVFLSDHGHAIVFWHFVFHGAQRRSLP
jgi:hypothetical protein